MSLPPIIEIDPESDRMVDRMLARARGGQRTSVREDIERMERTWRLYRATALALLALALFALVMTSCGHAPEIAPPNTEQACFRAIQCGAFLPQQNDECIACMEHVDQALLAKLNADYGPLPPLEQADCGTVVNVVQVWTNLASCVVGRWYGP